ncbi:hypothetical protein RQP53_03430 [Paucibacter sp. APW11]|uniref:Uncharacterized protein n=1 Tax=Roseateles aquae TaxID=3077235 RepID=A0ABU3P6Y5_9BURK|nr:hypothetical protein [Paucibacter sp. APW11]MDT8998324.1 hypothetical protein [Paucibacter sp. APW11]
MSSKQIHEFSDSKLHTALLFALFVMAALVAVDALFFTPEGQTPLIWHFDAVVVHGQSSPPKP